MTNKPSNMDKARDKESDRTIQPAPVFWIPFGIVSIGLVVIGLFRFSENAESIYFIYICLIAFAVAAFPWVSSIRVKGIFEIERAIDHVRGEARDQVEQASKRFDDRLLALRTELTAQLSSIQTQVAQQTSLQKSDQVFQVNMGLKGVELMETLQKEAAEQTDKDEPEVKLPTSSELPEKYSELSIGFAKATAVALNDSFGSRCGTLLRQVPEIGQSFKKFEETRLNSNVTDEQFRTMKTLGLITVKGDASIEPGEAIISVSEMGRIYIDYWIESHRVKFGRMVAEALLRKTLVDQALDQYF